MIRIKNKDYRFRLGFKALLNYEEATGKRAATIGQEITMKTMAEICYYAITSTGDKITIEEIIDAIDEDMSLLETIAKAMEQDMAAFNTLSSEAKK